MKIKFDIEKYKNIKYTKEYEKLVKDIKSTGLIYDDISRFCATTHSNIVATYIFLKEDFEEYSEICDEKIKTLKGFYWYE